MGETVNFILLQISQTSEFNLIKNFSKIDSLDRKINGTPSQKSQQKNTHMTPAKDPKQGF